MCICVTFQCQNGDIQRCRTSLSEADAQRNSKTSILLCLQPTLGRAFCRRTRYLRYNSETSLLVPRWLPPPPVARRLANRGQRRKVNGSKVECLDDQRIWLTGHRSGSLKLRGMYSRGSDWQVDVRHPPPSPAPQRNFLHKEKEARPIYPGPMSCSRTR
jgi:hypothetical protein